MPQLYAPSSTKLSTRTSEPRFGRALGKRYEGILSQGLLDELGDKHGDEITALTVRALMAVLGKRGIQSRGPPNLLRTLLTAAVETGALEAMSDPPKISNDWCSASIRTGTCAEGDLPRDYSCHPLQDQD